MRALRLRYPAMEIDESDAMRLARGFRGTLEFWIDEGRIDTLLFGEKRREMVDLFRDVYRAVEAREVDVWLPRKKPPRAVFVVGLANGNGFTQLRPLNTTILNAALRSLRDSTALLQVILLEYDWRPLARKLSSKLLKDAWAQSSDKTYNEAAAIGRTIARHVERKLHGIPLTLRIQGAIWGDPSPLIGVSAAFGMRGDYDALDLYVFESGFLGNEILKEVAYRGIYLRKGSLALMARKRVEDRLRRKHLLNIPVIPEEITDVIRLPSDPSLPIEYLPPTRMKYASVGFEEGYRLGVNFTDSAEFRLPPWALERHVYIIGATGTGKSTLIKNLIYKMREEGYHAAIHVIDPHGDLAHDLLKLDPDPKTLVYLDPLEVGYVLNPLELPEYESKEERDLFVQIKISELMKVFEQLFGATQRKMPRLTWILQTILRYLYEKGDDPTFEDIYRTILALRAKDPDLISEMTELLGEDKEMLHESMLVISKLPADAHTSVLNKLQSFAASRVLREIFSRRRSTVNLEELLKPGTLTIWRFSKSYPEELVTLGMPTAVLALWFSILSRARTEEFEERTPVLLFIDEFQNLQHLNLIPILLSESRKYGLLLFLIHQNLKQLSDELVESVLSNTSTQIIFRVSGEDAIRLAGLIDPSKREDLVHDLVNLPDFTAIIRVRPRDPSQPFTLFRVSTDPPPTPLRDDISPILEAMRARFRATLEERALGEPPFIAMISLDLSPKEYAVLNAIDLLGEEGYVKKVAEVLELRRSDVSKAIRKLEERGLIRFSETRKVRRGRIKLYRVTREGRKQLDPPIELIARSKMGRALAKEAVVYYRRKGFLVRVPRQETTIRPDMIAIPISNWEWDLKNAISLEVETTGEIAREPGQVRRNISKAAELGLRSVDVWCPEKDIPKLLEVLKGSDFPVRILVRGKPLEREEQD